MVDADGLRDDGHAELVTQATTFTRGYDPATGKELWRLSGNSEIAIPTPIVGPGFVIVTNGYRGVQPIFAIKPGATRRHHARRPTRRPSDFIAWSTNAAARTSRRRSSTAISSTCC